MLSGDFRIVLRDVGLLVPTVGLMAVVSLPVAAAFGEWYALWPLGLTALVSFCLGALLYLPFRGAGEAQLGHSLMIAALGWLLVATLGALPFYLISVRMGDGPVPPYADMASAFFESVSGFTTTGLTMSLRPDLLPHTLQWWRSFTQWIGGMGIIVLVLTLLAGRGTAAVALYSAEAREDRIHPSVLSTLRTMWWIYALYTLFGVVLLWGTGMPIWDAINHSMTSLSTGGFSISPVSAAAYPFAVQLALVPLMLLGATSFSLHYRILRSGVRPLWGDYQARGFVIFTLGWFLALFLENMLGSSAAASAKSSYFQAISAATTTGFQTVDVFTWSDTAKLILSLAMFVGAMTGSTAGGIKVARALLLIRGAGWRLKRLISSPRLVVPFRFGNETWREEEAGLRLQTAAVLIFLWGAFLGLGVLVLLHLVPERFGLADVIFEVASAQGTVGLSVGITNPGMPLLGKLVLCLNMWVGRLEIIPVLVLLRAIIRGSE